MHRDIFYYQNRLVKIEKRFLLKPKTLLGHIPSNRHGPAIYKPQKRCGLQYILSVYQNCDKIITPVEYSWGKSGKWVETEWATHKQYLNNKNFLQLLDQERSERQTFVQ